MCEFCENIYEDGTVNENTALKYQGMSIIKDNDGFKIAYLTKDYNGNDKAEIIPRPIKHCPMCGRKLVQK